MAAIAESTKHSFFRATDHVPEETWYWLALGSIGVSAHLSAVRALSPFGQARMRHRFVQLRVAHGSATTTIPSSTAARPGSS
jgi:hypothetical protein